MDFQSSSKDWKRQVILFFLVCNWGWGSGQLHYSIVEESQPGTVVGNVAQDLGINLSDIAKRRLNLGSEGNRSHFAVNQGSGALTVNERIDRESLCGSSSSCLLHIEVVTENPLELFSLEIEILDINDNSPTFSATDQVIRITELVASSGVRFPLEMAHDPDVGINGVSQYRLNPNPYFSLSVKNRKDGTLIPQLVLEKTLDREERREHNLILTAFDGGEQRRSGSSQITVIVIDINDNAPMFDQSTYKINLLENLPIGTIIMTLNATDPDDGPNGEIEYSFDHHTSGLAKEKFDLNPYTGEIYIKGVVDFEESNFYELSIRAVDKGVPELEEHCLIQVEVEDANDNPPEIILSSMMNEIPENAPLGTVVGFVNVKDRDSGKNGEVQLEVSPKLPFKFKPFKNRYSLVTDGFLDREKVPQYTIQFIASDLGAPPLHTQTTIILNVSDINDHSPAFLQSVYNAFIKENNEPGSLLCTLSAVDPDEGVNSEMIYSIVESQIDGSSVSSFVYIHPSNGHIYAQHSFDYEHWQVLQITARVEDCGSPKLFSNVSVFIFVSDTNDNIPTILYPEHSRELISQEKISKSVSVGYLVTKVSAVDLDSGHNAWLIYNLVEFAKPTLFRVSAYTGEVRTIRGFQETDNTDQRLVISVSDHGQPPLSTTVTILVNIVDDILQHSHKSHDFLANSKPTSDLTMYLIISLVAISLVSLVTFIILLVKCLKKEDDDSSSGCCFLNKPQSKHYAEQYQPTLYLNTDGTLKYMEVRMGPPETQGQCYQTCFPPATETHDFTFVKPLNFPHLQDMIKETETEASLNTSWLNDPNQVPRDSDRDVTRLVFIPERQGVMSTVNTIWYLEVKC
ncbi:hypothetical protein FKM82_011900 [Ascaphus truei]